MPMPVSSSRDTSMLGSSLAPVVRTTSAVAAAVVVSARSPRTEPAIRPTRIASPSDSALRPKMLPSANATSTPSTVAPTCWTPRRSVR